MTRVVDFSSEIQPRRTGGERHAAHIRRLLADYSLDALFSEVIFPEAANVIPGRRANRRSALS